MSSSSSVTWSKEEEKAFEDAIAMHWIDEDSKEQWQKIASMVPNKTVEELKQHYEMLVEDVNDIEAGNIPLPNYVDEETTTSTKDFHGFWASKKRSNGGYGSGFSGLNQRSRSEQERRKGIPWTVEEHRLFLLGLDKFGKGDWRSISRNFVISRTPTQVASHAQKYFIRLNSMNRDRRRSSIHDINSINKGEVSPHQAQITGEQPNTNPPAAAAAAAMPMGESLKHRTQHHMPGLGMYGALIGHPIVAPGLTASAVGTPDMLPSGNPSRSYVVPVAYPMAPPATMHQ